ncbi:MAG: metallopeptidase TldD-related protein, partial [Candidatus Cloacimonetes bacterium]|nr:metallopeptidase TldD-related protein [Candidatus Cloacimonadota bacterium]
LGLIDSLPEDPDFVDLETDLSKCLELPKQSNIEALSLSKKTQILAHLAEAVKPYGYEIYGTFICNYEKSRLINSNKLDKTYFASPIYLEVKAVHNQTQVTVLETFGGEDFSKFELEDFTSRLIQKAKFGLGEIIDIEPGQYDVVLAPRCVAEFLQYLSFGMSARAVDQKNSFFEGKIGEQIFPTFLNLVDDPSDPDVINLEYNGEGHIYNPLPLIKDGKFQSFMCDTYYHHKTGLPKNGNDGSCLVLKEGDKPLDELISSVQKGLFISSLHYMNFINAKETSLTGLTRDGTFLIEDGKITKVVNNLRFTERIERIFRSVVALEDRAYTIPFSGNYEDFGIEAVKAPHALVKDFNITSSTRTI